MTRPTDEQIKALRKGDVVTVRAVVTDVADNFIGVSVVDDQTGSGFFNKSVISSIEPREIKVGDRVIHPAYFNDAGSVRFIENGWSAVSFDSGILASLRLANLTVIS